MSAASHHRWQDVVVHDEQGPHPVRIKDDGGLRAVMAGLEPGQSIPPHADTASVFHILDGTGVLTVDDEAFDVTAGDTVTVPDGAVRGMTATTLLAFLGVKAI